EKEEEEKEEKEEEEKEEKEEEKKEKEEEKKEKEEEKKENVLTKMGDEKDSWKIKRLKFSDDRDSNRDSLEEGELRDDCMEITVRNSPYRREDCMEDRGEEDDSLAMKPPQQMSLKEKAPHRKYEDRKEKHSHRSHAAEEGKHARVKEKKRKHKRQKRHREEQDKARCEWERRKRQKMAREHSGREPMREQREQKELERRAEERRKEREALREVKEEKIEERDLLSDLQDISDSERKTSWAETSSAESGSGSEEEEAEKAEETGSNSDEASGQSAEVSQEEMSEGEEQENENHVMVESLFDRDSGDSEEGEEEVGEGTLQSSAPTEDDYVLDSPALSPIELKQELPKYLPALQGCRSVEDFQCLNRIEEGTYGVVYRARDKKTDEIVALKRLKMEKEKEGFPITSLREINTMLKAQHPNVVTVREIVVGSNMDKIYIVMNYVEHDLKSLMETMNEPFLPGEVKTLMIQLLRGVKHLHDNWILHRDLKTSNLLLSRGGILKVGDFGLAREYGSPLKAYTPVVVTLWYRAPELLLGAKEYSTAVDMWSVGCIFGELLTQKPLFPGKSEIDQINKVFKDLGTPSEKIWPGYNNLPAVKKMTLSKYPYNNLRKRFGVLLSDQGFDLMNKFLTYFPRRRINAEDGLKHEYFRATPLPTDLSTFRTLPAKSEQLRVKRGTSPRPPEGGLGCSQLGDDNLKETGFHLTTTKQGPSAAGPGFSLKF
uniref:Cyclin-dependent kinase 11B n=1 Tax=Chinchilla lanigera TaxID=34839 RepID=A0A8C2UZY2_CHILA